MPKVNQNGFIQTAFLILLLVGLGLGVYVVQQKTHILPFAAEPFNPTSNSQNKIVLADFYWWYPWYGGQYVIPPNYSQLLPPKNNNGYLGQDAFKYTFTQQIPYLQSNERPTGAINNQAAIDWFKGNFERAANSGIDVITPMSRPDLKNPQSSVKWKGAIGLMIQAQKSLRAEGKKYPKLLFHFDNIECWSGNCNNGDLTGPSPQFDAIWSGVKDSFDAIYANLTPAEVNDYIFTYPDSNTFTVFSYRIEGGRTGWVANNWWITRLKKISLKPIQVKTST